VRREPDTQDRRRKLLWITPEGEAAVLKMRPAAQRVQERLVAPLTPEEQSQLNALLTKLVFSSHPASGAEPVG
jgi:DNA-binding MarR family transcriptional regulator